LCFVVVGFALLGHPLTDARFFSSLLSQTLRGFDARLICMDEAAFIGRRMYVAGVLPVSQQRFTCTLMTTTPGDTSSYIMQQAAKIDANGNPLLPFLMLGDPCDDCKAANQYICTHKQDTTPFWKSTANRSKFGFFYEDDKETDMAENYNAQFNTTNYGIQPDYLRWLRSAPRWQDDHPPPMLVMGVDAAAGGQDEFAISIIYVGRDNHHVASPNSLCFFFVSDFIVCWRALAVAAARAARPVWPRRAPR
jgi:hypothetical protein